MASLRAILRDYVQSDLTPQTANEICRRFADLSYQRSGGRVNSIFTCRAGHSSLALTVGMCPSSSARHGGLFDEEVSGDGARVRGFYLGDEFEPHEWTPVQLHPLHSQAHTFMFVVTAVHGVVQWKVAIEDDGTCRMWLRPLLFARRSLDDEEIAILLDPCGQTRDYWNYCAPLQDWVFASLQDLGVVERLRFERDQALRMREPDVIVAPPGTGKTSVMSQYGVVDVDDLVKESIDACGDKNDPANHGKIDEIIVTHTRGLQGTVAVPSRHVAQLIGGRIIMELYPTNVHLLAVSPRRRHLALQHRVMGLRIDSFDDVHAAMKWLGFKIFHPGIIVADTRGSDTDYPWDPGSF